MSNDQFSSTTAHCNELLQEAFTSTCSCGISSIYYIIHICCGQKPDPLFACPVTKYFPPPSTNPSSQANKSLAGLSLSSPPRLFSRSLPPTHSTQFNYCLASVQFALPTTISLCRRISVFCSIRTSSSGQIKTTRYVE